MISLVGILGIIGLVIWLVRRQPPRRLDRDDVDWEELQDAEADVRDLGVHTQPDDEPPGADWGPGTVRPRRR